MSSLYDNTSDQDLLKYIQLRDEQAFTDLYDRYWEQLFLSAYKVLRDEETSKDIVQEVFINIWTNVDLGTIDNVKSYFHQTVRYKVLMELRRGKISEKHLKTLQTLEANSTEDLFNFHALNETIESTIQTLPEKCREVFVLSRMDHLTNKEIADRMNISVRTVETHISKALKVLRLSLDGSTALLITLFFGV